GRGLLERAPALAAEQAREILRVVPHSADALLLLGLALAAQGRIDEAVVPLREAARRNPESYETWRALGDQLVLTGDNAGADFAFAQ
ncbi:tetratricopeptide repeat protein, partial [Acinetobacter baumannii]